MTDQIKQAIADHAAEDLAAALQDASVECETDHSIPCQPAVDVPGYGRIYYDSDAGSPCGWVVRTGSAPEMTQHDEAVTEDVLADELTDLVADVQKVS